MAGGVLEQGAKKFGQMLLLHGQAEADRYLDAEDEFLALLCVFQHVDDTLDRVPQGRASPADFAHSLRAGTGKFSLHYQPDRCHCAIHAIGSSSSACVACATALRSQRGQRRLQAMGQVSGSAARLLKILLARIRKRVDRIHQRLHLAQIGRRQSHVAATSCC